MNFSDRWHALKREAELAAESMAIGVTALGKTDYVRLANYGQTFFSLSTGLERSAKLALCLEHVANHQKFPDNQTLKSYSHDLNKLLSKLDQIGERSAAHGKSARLPNTEIHKNIVQVLSDFSNNVTRYYNLDLLTQTMTKGNSYDPLERWRLCVTQLVLQKHLTDRARDRIIATAESMEGLIGEHSYVRYSTETREPITTVLEGSAQTGFLEYAKPYTRLYVLQICRFVATIISELYPNAREQLSEDIPYMNDFFRIFLVEDRYFKSRKTWSIYP